MVHLKSKSGIGLIVRIGILILIVAIYFLANQKIILNQTFQLTGVFKKTDGLRMGSLVNYRGVNIGVIEVIEIASDSTVRVEMKIQDDMRWLIMKDAVATIGTDGLFGNSFVRIISDNQEDEIIKNGAEINTFRAMKADRISEAFNSTVINTKRISDNLAVISRSLKGGELWRDSVFLNNTAKTLNGLKKIRFKYIEYSSAIPPIKANVRKIGNNTFEITESIKQIQNNTNSNENGLKTFLHLFASSRLPVEASAALSNNDLYFPADNTLSKPINNLRNYFNTKLPENDTINYKK